jgi:hypothetical protein
VAVVVAHLPATSAAEGKALAVVIVRV